LDFLFTFDGDRYLPTDHTRGPWRPELLHGGPVGALLAHGIEGARDDAALQVARLTIDLFRPVPYGPLSLAVEPVRSGKRIKLVDAFLSAEDGIVARAAGLLLRRSENGPGAVTLPEGTAIPPWHSLAPRSWTDLRDTNPEPPRFHKLLESRRMVEPLQGKLVAVWMRIPVLFLPETPLTPVQRLVALADATTSVGEKSRTSPIGLINADMSLHLYRDPVGEWLCLECVGRGDAAGVATASINLHDERGFFGHSLASGLSNQFTVRP
jgi:hypothetical protein